MRRTLSILPLLSLTLAAQQADEAELLALLNTPITVASKKALTTREAPGIVTLLRREEILASGARDLLELLRLVPGFEFGADVQGVVSVGVRGNWGHEGKVLLLWDGQEMNETRYATLQLGNHFPVDQIQQVEIIRGPGSAIYGGFAELAVINVITRGADTKGISASAGFSRDRQAGTRRSLSAAYGDRWGKVGFSAQMFTSRGLRSTSTYPDAGYGPTSLKEYGDLDPLMANLSLEVGGLSLRYLQDDYHISDFTSNFRPTADPTEIRFDGRYAEAKYSWKISDSFSLTPKLNWKDQSPWNYTTNEATSRHWVVRTNLELQASWDPSEAMNLVFGGSLSRDEGKATAGREFITNGETSLTFKSHAFFAQALWKTSPLNITLGARFDKHDVFGSSFVPRLALTKVMGTHHFKFLASKAFRAPVIENLELNPAIKPEKTTALELEWGTQVSSQVFASFNVFDIQVKNPISYVFTGTDFYANFDRSGTRGLEVDVQIRGGFGFVHSSLSYSQAVDNQVPFYTVPESSKYMVGLPNLKFTAGGSFRLGPTLSFNPTLVGLGPRYAYLSGANEPQRTPALAIVNLGLTWKPTEDVNLSFQVDNLLDSDITYIQAYGTLGDPSVNNPPIPGARREVSLRFGYRL